MKTARPHILAALALCQRDMLMYISYRGRVITQVMAIFATLAMFYYISRLVKVNEFHTSAKYFSYVVVGIIIAETLQSTVAVASTLRSELLTGTFERLVCSPFGAVNGIVSSVLFPILIQLVFSILTLCIGSLLFGMPIKWSTAPLAIPVALAGAAVFSALALLGASAVLVAKQTSTLAAYATLALGLLGGVYFPISLLPGWGRLIANIQPLTYLVGLMRHYLIGYPLQGSVTGATIHVLGFLLAASPAAYLALVHAVRFTRRRATILEY
jgi:ABC-2 type transport system permease protein